MKRQSHNQNWRGGFTLVELLVVIAIISVILSMTVLAVNFSRESERVRGGAAQVQSFLAGARDRAIYSGSPIGVRLFLDNTEYTDASGATLAGNRRTVSSMIYIDPSQTWSDGTIQMQRLDVDGDGTVETTFDFNGDGDFNDPTMGEVDLAAETAGQQVFVVAGVGTGWWELKRRGMLIDGATMEIPAGGTTYPISTVLIDTTSPPTAVQKLVLQIPYRDEADSPEGSVQAFESGVPVDYVLHLPPSILPMEPSILPDNVVIDLDGSQLPASWAPGATINSNAEFSQFMDVVFSPRGTVIGEAASNGLIHLYVCDLTDSIRVKEMIALSEGNTNFDLTGLSGFLTSVGVAQLVPAATFELDQPGGTTGVIEEENDEVYEIGDRRIVSLFTRTGAVAVYPVNPVDDSPADSVADDPFFYAETGEEAN